MCVCACACVFVGRGGGGGHYSCSVRKFLHHELLIDPIPTGGFCIL